MADLGSIGFAPGVDGITPLSLFNAYGFNSGPWIPAYPFETSYAIPGIMTPVENTDSAHNRTIRGTIAEDGVLVAGAQAVLLMQRKYGLPSAYSWNNPDTVNAQTLQHQGAITVPDLIRTVVSKPDGSFSFDDVRKGEAYLVLLYNPDSGTVNAKAVGAFIDADDDSIYDLALDFKEQNAALYRMFFILA